MKQLKPLTYKVNYHEVEAVCVDADLAKQTAAWCGGGVDWEWNEELQKKTCYIIVPNLLGNFEARPGDYIVRRGNRFAPFSAETFHNEYSVKNFTITYPNSTIPQDQGYIIMNEAGQATPTPGWSVEKATEDSGLVSMYISDQDMKDIANEWSDIAVNTHMESKSASDRIIARIVKLCKYNKESQ
jgi:hypothetical protein